MNGARRRIGLGITALAAGLALSGATLQLNPTVNRVESAHAALPPECDESLAPATTPRIDVARISVVEMPLDPQAPPPADLRPTLVRMQNALERNDRAAFDDAFADAKAIVADHPSGGGRRGVEGLLRIHEDAAAVWDAQFQSPFFDQSSALYARLRAYAGWEDAVRRGVLVDDRGVRFYPAAESRAFLTKLAASRLGTLGIRAPMPERRPRRVTTTEAAPAAKKPAPSRTTKRTTAPSKAAESRATKPVASQTAKPVASQTAKPVVSQTTKPVVSQTTKPVVSQTTKPAASQTAKPPAPAPSKPAAPAPQATAPATSTVSTAPASTTSAPIAPAETAIADTAFAVDTSLPADTAAATETSPANDVVTDATASTATTEPEEAKPSRTRSVIIPAILILIGLGVLIVLFRASK